MLSVLRLQNLAIVSSLELELEPGLNVITGETGAGKSIVLKAVELLRGKKATEDFIRAGAESAEVEGLFHLEENAFERIKAEFSEIESDELLIRRVIRKAGRSKAYINGQLTTLGRLEHLGSTLIDVTAQHYQQRLLQPDTQLELLDAYGGDDKLLEEVSTSFSVSRDAERTLSTFLEEQEQVRDTLGKLQAENEELSSLAVTPGEREELERSLERLGNVERISECLGTALELTEQRLDADLLALRQRLDSAIELGSDLKELRELVSSCQLQLEEVSLGLNTELSSLETNPQELEYMRERVSEIARMERRYNKSGDELLEYARSVEEQLAMLEGAEIDEKVLREKVEKAYQALHVLEQQLTALRQKTAEKLSSEMERGLAELGMDKARFRVALSPRVSSPSGADNIEFQLAANPGEDFKSIAKVASGGELSRVVLVLKSLLLKRNRPQIQVFDEVDVGVGGAIAEAIGEKLKAVSEGAQVLCVTHSAPVAACAQSHFKLVKTVHADQTQVALFALKDSERVGEIARMLAGKRVSKKFEASARELLNQAG